MFLISAVVITYNEEKNIGVCLDALADVADEIIILDSFSTDKTVAVAVSKGAIVKQLPFVDYTAQKNAAIGFASHEYVLSLDADEVLDKILIDAIAKARTGPPADAYEMNRCTNYCGSFIRHGSWYPDKKIRLFNKNKASWVGIDLHEKIELSGQDLQVRHLPGDILHYSFTSIEQHVKKCDVYSSILARSLYSRRKKSSWFKILVNPCWTFFQGYIIRLGCLDGFHGFVIAVNSAHATFLKYAKLYQLKRYDANSS